MKIVNPIIIFALEAIGFKETFLFTPLLYPLPSCETVPLMIINNNSNFDKMDSLINNMPVQVINNTQEVEAPESSTQIFLLKEKVGIVI